MVISSIKKVGNTCVEMIIGIRIASNQNLEKFITRLLIFLMDNLQERPHAAWRINTRSLRAASQTSRRRCSSMPQE